MVESSSGDLIDVIIKTEITVQNAAEVPDRNRVRLYGMINMKKFSLSDFLDQGQGFPCLKRL